MTNRFWQKLKHHFLEVIRIKKSPHSIAMGFAIGTFISILPTPGINILLALLVALIYRNVNKFALFGAILFWNPLTMILIYLASYRIGDFFFVGSPIVKYDIVFLDQIYNFTRRYLVGSILLAVTISAASYMLVRLIATLYRYIRARSEKE